MTMSILWIAVATGLFVLTAWRPRSVLYVLPTAIIFSPELVVAQYGSEAVFVTLADVISLALVLVVLRQRKIRFRSVWLVGGLFVLLAVVSSVIGILSETVRSGLFSAFYIAKFTQYLFVGLAVSTIVEEKRDLGRAVVGLSVAMLLGLALFPFLLQRARFALPFTAIQETAVIGAMVVVLLAPLLVDSEYEIPTGHAIALLLVVLAGLLFIVASAGRAGILGLVAGGAYVTYRQPELSLPRVLPVVCALGLLMVPVLLLLETPATERLESSIRIVMTFSFEDASSLNKRLVKWQEALEVWARNPILGVGMPGKSWKWLDGWYVRVLAETGVIGLTTWLVFMADTYRHILAAAQVRAYVTGVVGVLFVMCVASVFGARFLTINTAMLFWFIVGTSLSVASESE